MRGYQVITSNFPTAVESKPEQKGHKSVHQDRRDDALAARFYYHFHILRKRYDDCLTDMEAELFLTPLYIAQRLATKGDYMKQLLRQEADRNALKKLFPFYSWN